MISKEYGGKLYCKNECLCYILRAFSPTFTREPIHVYRCSIKRKLFFKFNAANIFTIWYKGLFAVVFISLSFLPQIYNTSLSILPVNFFWTGHNIYNIKVLDWISIAINEISLGSLLRHKHKRFIPISPP